MRIGQCFILLFVFTYISVQAQTTLERGDVAIVGYNANNQVCNSGVPTNDLIAIVFLKEIEAGTTFIVTDNGYLGNQWFNREGIVRFTFNPPITANQTIDAGKIMRFILFQNSDDNYCITPEYENSWDFSNIDNDTNLTTSLALATSGDQVYLLNGDDSAWNNNTYLGNDAIFNGTVLYGISSSGWTNTVNSNNSQLHPDVQPCFYKQPISTNKKYHLYDGPNNRTSKIGWINRLHKAENWDTFNNCGAYNTADSQLNDFEIIDLEVSISGNSVVCSHGIQNYTINIPNTGDTYEVTYTVTTSTNSTTNTITSDSGNYSFSINVTGNTTITIDDLNVLNVICPMEVTIPDQGFNVQIETISFDNLPSEFCTSEDEYTLPIVDDNNIAGDWTNSAGDTILSINPFSLTPGNYTYTFNSSNDCTFTYNFTVNSGPTLTPELQEHYYMCEGNPISMSYLSELIGQLANYDISLIRDENGDGVVNVGEPRLDLWLEDDNSFYQDTFDLINAYNAQTGHYIVEIYDNEHGTNAPGSIIGTVIDASCKTLASTYLTVYNPNAGSISYTTPLCYSSIETNSSNAVSIADGGYNPPPLPTEADGQTFEYNTSWRSSNTDVIMVDGDGNITPIGPGQSIITYTVTNPIINPQFELLDILVPPYNCDDSDSFPVTVVASPYAGEDGNLTICAGTTPTTAQLEGALGNHPTTGTEPDTGTWQNNNDGTWTYTVGNAADRCGTDIAVVTITEVNLSITEDITDANCNQNDGKIDITISGFTETDNLSYSWSGPDGFTSTDEDLTGLAAGSYTVTVSDNGISPACTEQATFIVDTNDIIIDYTSLAPTIPPVFCSTDEDVPLSDEFNHPTYGTIVGTWHIGSATGAVTDIIDVSLGGQTYVFVPNDECFNEYDILIVVNNLPTTTPISPVNL